jgi:2-hydroxychromene-2-carboxylate isomerase
MGELIHLPRRRAEHGRRKPATPAAFFFDVSCPLSYLASEHVERRLGEVEWVSVDGAALRGRSASESALRSRAEIQARSLRLPLVWPDNFATGSRRARRAASFACEIGVGPAFALAASRLAFCGGYDLDDPEVLTEAAAAARVPLDGCLEAAGQTWRDEELTDATDLLLAQGMTELPSITVGGRWFAGDGGLWAAAAVLAAPRRLDHPLAPVG